MCRYLSRRTGGLALEAGAARMRRAATGLGLMLAVLCLPTAHAIDHCVLSGDNAPVSVAHVVGSYEVTSKNNDFLTDWIHVSHPEAWTCTRKHMPVTPVAEEVILKAYMPALLPHPHDFNFEGEHYHIFNSQLLGSPASLATNIGFIMTRRYRIKAASGYDWESPWLPARLDTTGGSHPPAYSHSLALPNNDTYTVSFEYKIRLLKRSWGKHASHPFPQTGKTIEFQAVEWWMYRANGGTLPIRKTRIRTWFNREDKTCTTPSSEKTVYLRRVETSAFTGVGSGAGKVGFNLDLLNCSSKVKEIKYKLAPVRLTGAQAYHPTALETTPWPLTPVQGTLPLGAGTTATGVHVQVLDGDGNPVRFDRTTLMRASYSKGDGAASIPLQARYLQTGSTVTAGKVYATMSVLYMYN